MHAQETQLPALMYWWQGDEYKRSALTRHAQRTRRISRRHEASFKTFRVYAVCIYR